MHCKVPVALTLLGVSLYTKYSYFDTISQPFICHNCYACPNQSSLPFSTFFISVRVTGRKILSHQWRLQEWKDTGILFQFGVWFGRTLGNPVPQSKYHVSTMGWRLFSFSSWVVTSFFGIFFGNTLTFSLTSLSSVTCCLCPHTRPGDVDDPAMSPPTSHHHLPFQEHQQLYPIYLLYLLFFSLRWLLFPAKIKINK